MIAGWSDGVADALNSRRAIISVNCPSHLVEKLRLLFGRLGNTRILLSHLGMPGAMRSARKKLQPVLGLAALPHVGVKLSGVYACNDHPHPGLCELLEDLLRAYGGSRLYWGSDFSPALDVVTFAQTLMAYRALSRRVPAEVFARNLQDVIRRVRSPGVPAFGTGRRKGLDSTKNPQ